MSSCAFTGSPPLNTDIAGIGVRISTYVQAFLAVVVITVSPSMEEIYSQSLIFTIMNIAVVASAIILGFSSDPQISLQDAVVTWFFTIIPLIVLHIAGMKMRHGNKISNAVNSSDWDLIPAMVSMYIMYALSAAFTLAVFRDHERFGSNPECNGAARLFFFGTRKVSHGWFVGMAVFYGILLAFAFIPVIIKLLFLSCLFSSRRKPVTDEEHQEAEKQRKRVEELKKTPANPDFHADYRWGVIVSIVLVIWVSFTELTVAKNHFAPPNTPIWQFGQIFPMFFLVLPLLTTSKALTKFLHEAQKREAERPPGRGNGKRAGLVESVSQIVGV